MFSALLLVASLIVTAVSGEGYGPPPPPQVFGIPPGAGQQPPPPQGFFPQIGQAAPAFAGPSFAGPAMAGPAFFSGPLETRTPLGALAGFKGDLIYPVLHVGFFIVGVIVVVKILLSVLSLFKQKLLFGLGATQLQRKRRDTASSNPQIDSLTNVVMAALEGQECMQRMTCELGSFVRDYDQNRILSGLAERFAAREMTPYVEAFKDDDCAKFRCGRLAVRK